ncbi:MAG: MBL fold metallo-hydrolase [Planctomycetota bacterium]
MKTHGPLNIEVFIEPSFQENGLLLWPVDGRDCWIIDPGFSPQPDQLAAAVAERELTPQAVLLTHCHVDHLAGVPVICEKLPAAKLWVPRDEEHMPTDATENLSASLGMPISTPAVDRLIAPGDTLELGDLKWQVLDVGGHSPGGLAFYCQQAGVVIVGDALFAGSIGRYDFPGSSGERLLKNINENLLTLPEETVVYSGHGPDTTIGHERDTNPFLRPGGMW